MDFNRNYIIYLLRIKFPGINFYRSEWLPDKSIVHIAQVEEVNEMGTTRKFTSTADKLRIQEFLDGLQLPRVEIVDDILDKFPEIKRPTAINEVFNKVRYKSVRYPTDACVPSRKSFIGIT